jgi:hypothetical protein
VLLLDWAALTASYGGWSLNEIKELSPRERTNWLEISRAFGKVVRN